MRYRDDKTHFHISTKSEHAKTDDFWFEASDNDIWNGNRMWIHSFERKLSALSNAVYCKVVQRMSRELFGLKARGDIFLNHPVYSIPERSQGHWCSTNNGISSSLWLAWHSFHVCSFFIFISTFRIVSKIAVSSVHTGHQERFICIFLAFALFVVTY